MTEEQKNAADVVIAVGPTILNLVKTVYGKIDKEIDLRLKRGYEEYLATTRDRWIRSKSFFARNEPVELYEYYIPAAIRCDDVVIDAPSSDKVINHSHRVVITGSGGTGKSILMRHLFLDTIREKRRIPILVELRNIPPQFQKISEIIQASLKAFGLELSIDYIDRALSIGHFAIFLDGYDEISTERQQVIYDEIVAFSRLYEKTPMIISTRFDERLEGTDEYSVFSICPLSESKAIALVGKLRYDEEIKEKFSEALRNGLFERHESFLSNPLLLSIMLLTYGENADIPNKLSLFYNQAYEALFHRHDALKAGYKREKLSGLDIQEFSKVFALFSVLSYEKEKYNLSRSAAIEYIEKSKSATRKEFRPDDYLSDLISATCLMLEDGLEIAYAHRSFQEYFVALFISQTRPELQRKLLFKFLNRARYDSVFVLLAEINIEAIERELIIPFLDNLWSKIGIADVPSIGDAARIFLHVYSTIEVHDGDVVASIRDSDASFVFRLMSRIDKTCQEHFATSSEEFSDFRRKFFPDASRVYNSRNLNSKSKVLKSLLNERGAFSHRYFIWIWKSHASMKEKHLSNDQSFDSLLGIA